MPRFAWCILGCVYCQVTFTNSAPFQHPRCPSVGDGHPEYPDTQQLCLLWLLMTDDDIITVSPGLLVVPWDYIT